MIAGMAEDQVDKPSLRDARDRVCVVGAGSSGLTAARNLLAEGLPVDVLERSADLGGNWNYGTPYARVYRSTHTISSKPGTEYPDFPMPDAYPDYPHHTEILAYLRDYAERFGLLEHIEFEREVSGIERSAEPGPFGDVCWDVETAGEVRRYGAVVIANGHNWDPKIPEYPGDFTGRSMHSAEYRTPEMMEGRRVLVVGGGNSGCDIVVESAHRSEAVYHSTRRGYHYFPKYLWGVPSDQVGEVLLSLRVPVGVRRLIAGASRRIAMGSYASLGLSKPDHKLFETHPIVNSLLPYFIQHGAVTPKPDIERLEGSSVRFVDGSVEKIDVIVWATGYNLVFPFLDEAHLNWSDGRPHFFQHVFHPQYDNLFIAGMIQPDSGQFGIVHWQCRAIALYLASVGRGSRGAERLKRLKRSPDARLGAGIRYKESSRHRLEVEHHAYTRGMKKLVRVLER
jgi:cation diffusion facilitator CzcD-associated flavoprotein CzcO